VTRLVGDAAGIPFLDVGAAYRELHTEIDAAVRRTLERGSYVLGPEVETFEHVYADYVQAAHAVGTGNGLDALTLALRALEIGPGAEVIVPSHTFIATWLAVSAVGATPVPVDPDPETFLIDADAVAPAIGPRTRAIVPVHLCGRPVDLDPLLGLARQHGLAVVEDAAQAHGARYRGRRLGAHGNAVCWSFYPGKNLGAIGDGGAVTTDDAQLARRVRRLANYGSEEKYHHDELGVNSRLDEVQAAVLRVKLRHLDEWNARRRQVAALYGESLGALDGLQCPPVPPASQAEAIWHLYVLRSARRDALATALGSTGIGTLLHYPIPPHRQPPYASEGHVLPGADQLATEVLSLPMGPHLGLAQADRVVEAVLGALVERS